MTFEIFEIVVTTDGVSQCRCGKNMISECLICKSLDDLQSAFRTVALISDLCEIARRLFILQIYLAQLSENFRLRNQHP